MLAPLTRLLASTIHTARAPYQGNAMVVSVLAVTASSWGVLMGLAPVLQIRRMLRERSSREVSLSYFMILLTGFLLWISYGITAGNMVLVVPNSIALLVGLALVTVALRLRHPSRRPADPPAPRRCLSPGLPRHRFPVRHMNPSRTRLATLNPPLPAAATTPMLHRCRPSDTDAPSLSSRRGQDRGRAACGAWRQASPRRSAVPAGRRYRRGPPSTAAKRSLTVAAVRSGGASQTSALKISTST